MGHDSTVWALSFSATGSHLASVSEDRSLRVWECGERDGEPFYKFVCAAQGEHVRAIFTVAWGDAGLIATGCGACARLTAAWDVSPLTYSAAHITAALCGMMFP